MGMDVATAADSAIAVATSNMVARLLPFLARLGVGPADLTLLLYGGAGGLHGPILAEEIGIGRIIVPRLPSVFCAFGSLAADLVHDAVRSVHGDPLDVVALGSIVAELSGEGRRWVERQSRPGQLLGMDQIVFAAMRYAAQSFTIEVDLTAVVAGQGDMEAVAAAFHRAHASLFGHANPSGAVVIDEIRLRSIGRQARPAARAVAASPMAAPEPMERRDMRIGGVPVTGVPVYSRSGLPVGWHCAGPAIIEQDIATVLVLPGHLARVGAFGDLELTRAAE
jgi:N-methylhydantoinase A